MTSWALVNTSKHERKGRHFADAILVYIFLTERFHLQCGNWQYVSLGSDDEMAWRWTGDKLLPEPMVTENHDTH